MKYWVGHLQIGCVMKEQSVCLRKARIFVLLDCRVCLAWSCLNQTPLGKHRYYPCQLSKESHVSVNDWLYNINQNDFFCVQGVLPRANLNDLLNQVSLRNSLQFCAACSSLDLADVSYETEVRSSMAMLDCFQWYHKVFRY